MTRIDVVVAVRDEEASLADFMARVDALVLPPGVQLSLRFVEDSSRDGTRPLLRRLAEERGDVGYWMLERGFGQGLALSFGLARSTADAAIVMDVDGSHPPEAIPELVRAFQEGARVAQCVRRSLSGRTLWRTLGARAFHATVRLVTGVNLASQNVYYRLMDRSVIDSFLGTPRYWRYVRFPLPREAGAVRFVPIDTQERSLGASKYGPLRLLGLSVDGILGAMATRRLIFTAGLAAVAVLALFAVGAWPLALLGLAAAGAVALRFSGLRRPDALDRMRVTETAGTGAPV
ncbi:MAG: glycosyltransferase [Myxococcota bacterium]|nr:glycosyltransferase [Myxococcota bacterium]